MLKCLKTKNIQSLIRILLVLIKNKECILYILSHSSVLPLVTLSQHHFVPSALTFQPRLLHYPLNSFSTTISSVNFFGKSIPLPFFFFFQCKYFLFVLIWFTKGDPPPLDNIQVLMPNDYIVQLYHRHCYIAHSSWITQLHIKFLSKYFYEILCIPTACQAQLI